MMQNAAKEKIASVWNRFSLWASSRGYLVRLVSLTVGLLIILAFLPPNIRTIFWAGLQSHKILVSMLLIFNLIGISLVWSSGQKLDEWTFLFLNKRGNRPVWLDKMMLSFTQIGSGFTALIITLVLYLDSNRLLAFEFVLGSLSLWLVVEILKYLFDRSRPFIRFTQARIVGFRAMGRSFPSGHTSQAFFMATFFTNQFHLGIGGIVALYIIAVLVGLTRMYVGAHYPRDVIGGAVLGSSWGVLASLLYPTWLGLP
jgi:membrane-associated phospholipid phosphatase